MNGVPLLARDSVLRGSADYVLHRACVSRTRPGSGRRKRPAPLPLPRGDHDQGCLIKIVVEKRKVGVDHRRRDAIVRRLQKYMRAGSTRADHARGKFFFREQFPGGVVVSLDGGAGRRALDVALGIGRFSMAAPYVGAIGLVDIRSPPTCPDPITNHSFIAPYAVMIFPHLWKSC